MPSRDCNTCDLYRNALTDAGINRAMVNDFNNRQNDIRANDIEQMIIDETDKTEVKRLQVLQFLTNQNSGIISGINELKQTVEKDILGHKKAIEQIKGMVDHHEVWVVRLKTSWFWIAGAFGIAQIVFGLGLTRILANMDNLSEMNLKTREYVHEAIPSNLKDIVSPVENNLALISKLKVRLDSQLISIEQNERDIEELQLSIARISSLKTIKNSK